MAAILEDTAVPPLLDAAPERVRSEPRKGRFPRFLPIPRPTNAPYGAHYERGEASRPIPKPLNGSASRPAGWQMDCLPCWIEREKDGRLS